jgi:hypothetical protein
VGGLKLLEMKEKFHDIKNRPGLEDLAGLNKIDDTP